MDTLVKIRDLHKVYFRGSERIDVLQGVTLDIPQGDFLALMGPSGSGKTTLLLCDEPTGDLDRKSGDEVLDLLQTLNREHGKTIVMVTHDPHAAARARRTLHLEKGLLVSEVAA